MLKSEERVDKRCRCGSREDHQHAEQQQHYDDRHEPILLLLAEHRPELADERFFESASGYLFEVSFRFHKCVYWNGFRIDLDTVTYLQRLAWDTSTSLLLVAASTQARPGQSLGSPTLLA